MSERGIEESKVGTPNGADPDAPPGAAELLERALRVAIGVSSLVVEALARELAATFPEPEADVEAAGSDEGLPPRRMFPLFAGASMAIAFDATARAARLAATGGRTIASLASFATGFGFVRDGLERGERALEDLDRRWRDERAADERLASGVLRAIVQDVVDATLDQLDLTEIAVDRVDLDRVARSIDVQAIAAGLDLDEIASRIDVDALARRVDIEAIVRRLDLAAIAREVIDEIDLPQIVRESTGTLADEAVEGVRAQSMEADRRVERVVDRLLRRTGGRDALETAGDGRDGVAGR